MQREKDNALRDKDTELREVKRSMMEDVSRTQRYPNPNVQMSMYEKHFDQQKNENYSVISPENYEESRKVSAMKKITEELVEKLKK